MRRLVILTLLAASVWGLNLDEALRRATEHSPLLLKAEADERHAKSAVHEAKSAFHPYISAGYRWQHTNKTTTFSFSPTYQYSLSAGYSLFNGMSDRENLDARKLDVASKALMIKSTSADVKLRVIFDYMACLKAEKTVQTQKETLASLTRQYNDTTIRFEQGMVAKNEMLQIDVQRLRSEQALFAAESDLVRSRAGLRRTIGGLLESDETIGDINADVPGLDSVDVLLEKTYATRSELKALNKQKGALFAQRRALKGNYYPSVDLQADYLINDKERSSGSALVQQRDEFRTTVNINWSLYAGGITQAQRKGLLEQVRMIDADTAAMKLELRYQLEEAIEAFRVAKSAKKVAHKAKESAEENYRIVSDRFSYGQVDTLTLLKANSDLTDALNSYNNAYYDLYAAYAAIERITGE